MPDEPDLGVHRRGGRARSPTAPPTSTASACAARPAGARTWRFLTAMANSFGGRWFDENWTPQFDQPEWKETLQFYVDLMKDAGPQGASSNGFNENLTLFQQGKCGMWIDATVAGSFVTDPTNSTVADKVGFALCPDKRPRQPRQLALVLEPRDPGQLARTPRRPRPSSPGRPARPTPTLVAEKEGWANVPPGTRTSLYENPEYQDAAPFAEMTLAAMNAADITKPTVEPVPYTGVQFVAIPEFQGLGTTVGQLFSAALAGQMHGRRRARPGAVGRDPRDDPGRLHQVGASSRRLGRPARSGRPLSHRQTSVHRVRPRGRPPWPRDRPSTLARLHDGAVGDPPADLDDRAAGDDALLLVPELQPAEPGDDAAGPGSFNYQLLLHRPGLLRSRSGTRWCSSSACCSSPSIGGIALAMLIDQPMFGQGIVRILVISPFFVMPPVAALVWKNMIMHPGYGVFADIAQLLRGAAGRLVRPVPAVLDHHHRRLAVAALRHADPAHLAAVARQRADGGGRDGRRQLRQPLHLPDPAAHGPRDHRRDPDPDHLPARRSTPRSSSPPTAARATPRPTCRS